MEGRRAALSAAEAKECRMEERAVRRRSTSPDLEDIIPTKAELSLSSPLSFTAKDRSNISEHIRNVAYANSTSFARPILKWSFRVPLPPPFPTE